MVLNRKERRLVGELAATLRSEFGATEVWLYGSAARGDLQEGSDIDLLVVLPTVNWAVEKRVIERCFEAELQCGRVISAACLGTDEWSGGALRASPFIQSVRQEGFPL